MKKYGMAILFLLILFASGCVPLSSLSVIDPAWSNALVEDIAFIGFVPYSKAFDWTESTSEGASFEQSLWWDEDVNDALFNRYKSSHKEFNWLPPDSIMHRLNLINKQSLIETFTYTITLNTVQPKEFTAQSLTVNTGALNKFLIKDLCEKLDVDAIMVGVIKPRLEASSSSSALVVQSNIYRVNLYSGLMLIDKEGRELWRTSYRFSTAIGTDIKIELQSYVNPTRMVEMNTPLLMREVSRLYNLSFPHRGVMVSSIAKPNPIPFILYDADKLRVWSYPKARVEILDPDDKMVASFYQPSLKTEWDYTNNGFKVPSRMYKLKVNYPSLNSTQVYDLEGLPPSD